jgi:hypothetical protein
MIKNTQNSFTGGMDWLSMRDLVKNTQYETALNAVVEDEVGNTGGLVTECSNYECASFPDNVKVIGSVKVEHNGFDEYVLFCCSPDRTIQQLYLFNPSTCTKKLLIQNTCFNFDTRHPVNSLCKIKDNSDRIIYFTDKLKYR